MTEQILNTLLECSTEDVPKVELLMDFGSNSVVVNFGLN